MLWITRLVAATITALGIALIAALATAGAIAGGISLIILGAGLLSYAVGMPILREKFHESWYLTEIRKKFQCAEDFTDLPKVEYLGFNKHGRMLEQVRILLKTEQLAGEKGVLRGMYKDKLSFLICFKKTAENERQINLVTLGRQKQRKEFVVEYDGQDIPMEKKPISISLFGNNCSEEIAKEIA